MCSTILNTEVDAKLCRCSVRTLRYSLLPSAIYLGVFYIGLAKLDDFKCEFLQVSTIVLTPIPVLF